MIDLMALAKKVDETYIDVECSFGTLRVHHVPDAVLLSASANLPEPIQPMVTMKTATGTQERLIKKGDKEYDEWIKDLTDYNNQSFELRQAQWFVLALQDIDWSEVNLSSPPPVKIAQVVYNGNWPENELKRKMIWIDFVLLSMREDKNKVLEARAAMNEVSEPTAEMVEEVKKNSD